MKEYLPIPINTKVQFLNYFFPEDKQLTGIIIDYDESREITKQYVIDTDLTSFRNIDKPFDLNKYISDHQETICFTSFYLVREYSIKFEKELKRYLEFYKEKKKSFDKVLQTRHELRMLFKNGKRNYILNYYFGIVRTIAFRIFEFIYRVIFVGTILIFFGGIIRIYRSQIEKLQLAEKIKIQKMAIQFSNNEITKNELKIELSGFESEVKEIDKNINSDSYSILAIVIAVLSLIVAVK